MTTVAKLFKGTLTFTAAGTTPEESDWSCQATNVVLEQDDGDTEDPLSLLCGTELGGETTAGAYHLLGTVVQDWSAVTPDESIQKFSWLHNGEVCDVEFVPDDKGTVTAITGQVTMKFLGLGGDANVRITRDFDFTFTTKPGIAPWDPVTPPLVTA